MSQSTAPPDRPRETRLELRLDRAIARATTPRGAAIVIAVATISITFAAGLLMKIVDSEHYPSLGSGLWWAIQTVTTVGYGDNPPSTAVGRFVAGFVMLFGIGFVSVITAAITSAFVSRPRTDGSASDDGRSSSRSVPPDRQETGRDRGGGGRRFDTGATGPRRASSRRPISSGSSTRGSSASSRPWPVGRSASESALDIHSICMRPAGAAGADSPRCPRQPGEPRALEARGDRTGDERQRGPASPRPWMPTGRSPPRTIQSPRD